MAVTPQVVILAAGKGTRLKSETAKVLQRAAGLPLLEHVLRAANHLKPAKTTVVVGYRAEAVSAAFADRGLEFVLQEPQQGTGHALLAARSALPMTGDVVVLSGDVPLVQPETLLRLLAAHREAKAQATLLTATLSPAGAYGRIVRDELERPAAIVEARDATPAQLELDEINAGLYVFDAAALARALTHLTPNNAQGEYYLTDVVRAIGSAGGRLEALRLADPQEVAGVNTMAELAATERVLWQRRAVQLQEDGVRLEQPDTIQVGPDVTVLGGAVLRAYTFLEGRSHVASGAVIGPFVRLENCVVAAGARVLDHCLLLDSEIGAGAVVGPFAHLRPGTRVLEGAKVGNFVELKNATLGAGAKAPHLSYLGDASIGARANVGAGTITCNYDGVRKHRTEIGAGAFVGSNSTLVAPVNVGTGAYVAAGSTITSDVPDDALGLARARQVVKPGWARSRREAEKAAKR